MLNKFDDNIAPHFCQYFLILICITQFFLFLVSKSYFFYIFIFTFFISFFFSLKVILLRNERNRIYEIIKSRILKSGYSKEIFSGKCNTICNLTQAVYIAIRLNHTKDVLFFFKDRKIKKTSFIIEDENLEKILNELNVKDIKEGTVIYESNFKKLNIKKTDS